MSKEQKDLRLQIEKCQNQEWIKQLRKSRKKILKQINEHIKDAKEKLADYLVGEIENPKDDTIMFKAAKFLYTKHQRVQFVHDKQKRCLSQPQKIQRIIGKHFKNHLKKDNTNPTEKFVTPPKRLNKMITAKEVTKAVQKMASNNINVEVIKYTPEEVQQYLTPIMKK